jgi:hypothetical protein
MTVLMTKPEFQALSESDQWAIVIGFGETIVAEQQQEEADRSSEENVEPIVPPTR